MKKVAKDTAEAIRLQQIAKRTKNNAAVIAEAKVATTKLNDSKKEVNDIKKKEDAIRKKIDGTREKSDKTVKKEEEKFKAKKANLKKKQTEVHMNQKVQATKEKNAAFVRTKKI